MIQLRSQPWGCLPWQPRIASAPHRAGEAMAHRSPCILAGPGFWWVGCYYGHTLVGLPRWSPPQPIFSFSKKKKKKKFTTKKKSKSLNFKFSTTFLSCMCRKKVRIVNTPIFSLRDI